MAFAALFSAMISAKLLIFGRTCVAGCSPPPSASVRCRFVMLSVSLGFCCACRFPSFPSARPLFFSPCCGKPCFAEKTDVAEFLLRMDWAFFWVSPAAFVAFAFACRAGLRADAGSPPSVAVPLFAFFSGVFVWKRSRFFSASFAATSRCAAASFFWSASASSRSARGGLFSRPSTPLCTAPAFSYTREATKLSTPLPLPLPLPRPRPRPLACPPRIALGTLTLLRMILRLRPKNSCPSKDKALSTEAASAKAT
mmetsp:Transcript_859/g.3586  ORF Transcript_859/g.3586 Transcript_859/m.3586 type:complete len:254 (+) Transcript_859:2325-3086(+)